MKGKIHSIKCLGVKLLRSIRTGFNSSGLQLALLLIFVFAGSLNLFAPPPPPPPPSIPIDGGIGWLIGAGVVYGFKKSRELGRKRRKS